VVGSCEYGNKNSGFVDSRDFLESFTISTGFFPEVKSGRGVTLTPHALLVPLVMKE
jgi:hypothetical protein